MSERFELAVVGGGVIGLACAWRAAQRGLRVAVLDAGAPGNASHAAAGMLAPGERARRERPPADAAQPCELRALPRLRRRARGADRASTSPSGSAARSSSRSTRRTSRSWRRSTPPSRRKASRRSSSTAMPAARSSRASRRDRRGLWTRDEGQVTRARSSRRWSGRAAQRASRSPRRPRRARGDLEADRIVAVATATTRIEAGRVLLAAGARTGSEHWLPEAARLPVEPVKGQLLRARLSEPPARILVRSASAYVVPRPDGRVVVGATSERSGFDESRTVEARGAPGRGDALPARDRGGPRPGALRRLPARDPDGLPLIGATASTASSSRRATTATGSCSRPSPRRDRGAPDGSRLRPGSLR